MQNQNPDILLPKVQAGTFFVSGRFRGGPSSSQVGSGQGPSSFSGRLPKLGNGYGFWILVLSSVSRGLSPSATKKTTGASSSTEMMTGRAFSLKVVALFCLRSRADRLIAGVGIRGAHRWAIDPPSWPTKKNK
ncbi:hypothetical protein TIFTF001_037113 [Ficus carica]|uniref:Uncharacterized protein n=1 Tax=Ficus carica TaxID=3494 RepID=A0AA88JBJ3_FICCA|nr:hypothetical protein TIFTF001_037113 [Ficus carica]